MTKLSQEQTMINLIEVTLIFYSAQQKMSFQSLSEIVCSQKTMGDREKMIPILTEAEMLEP